MDEQFPQWASRRIEPVELDGWDNSTFRLGEDLSIRLPSAAAYEAQVDKEHRWIPVLARDLPVQISEPVAKGEPDAGFPRKWSIYRWLPGQTARLDRIDDQRAFANSLAEFLRVLHTIDSSDGPPPGDHNFLRGGALSTYDMQTRESIEILRHSALADDIDLDGAESLWDAALSTNWSRPPVWIHGDLVASNLLVVDGRLSAVIDFGCAAVGDPACDLVMMWTFFDSGSAEAFRHGVNLDADTWSRARGWALWKALLLLVDDEQHGRSSAAAATRSGWSVGCVEIIRRLLAEHAG